MNNHAHVLKAKAGVSLNSFICNYLNIFEYNGYVSGTTRTKLIQSEMRRIPIPLPPLPTQRRIVSILEKAEETKKLRAQADELTDRLLQSVFIEMFGDPVRNPKGWEIKTINEICDRITDGEHITPQRTNEGIYLLSARNIHNHRIALEDVDFIGEEEYE
ncbi:MAG: restriction endonuclease subunit S, partial [Candidatus Methanoperedens sp.]|nr:restriction endonuclease subunit S [Candidatus Methanoperedens sp.]